MSHASMTCWPTTSLWWAPFVGCSTTLRAFAAEHRRLQYAIMHSAIDRYLQPTGRSGANPTPAVVASADRLDRHTDERTDTRKLHRPCSAYYAGSVSNTESDSQGASQTDVCGGTSFDSVFADIIFRPNDNESAHQFLFPQSPILSTSPSSPASFTPLSRNPLSHHCLRNQHWIKKNSRTISQSLICLSFPK